MDDDIYNTSQVYAEHFAKVLFGILCAHIKCAPPENATVFCSFI